MRRTVLAAALLLAAPSVAQADLRLGVTGPVPAAARAGDNVLVTLTVTNEGSQPTRGDAIHTRAPSFSRGGGRGDGFFCSGRVDPRANTCILMEDMGPGERRTFTAIYTPFAGGLGVLEVWTGRQTVRITTDIAGPPYLEAIGISGATAGAAPRIRYTATTAGRVACTVVRRRDGVVVARFARPISGGRGTFRWAGGRTLPRGGYLLRAVPRNAEGAGRPSETAFRVR